MRSHRWRSTSTISSSTMQLLSTWSSITKFRFCPGPKAKSKCWKPLRVSSTTRKYTRDNSLAISHVCQIKSRWFLECGVSFSFKYYVIFVQSHLFRNSTAFKFSNWRVSCSAIMASKTLMRARSSSCSLLSCILRSFLEFLRSRTM